MEPYILVLVFVFVVLIYVAMNTLKYHDNQIAMIGLISAATFVLFYFIFDRTSYTKISEYFQSGTDAADETALNKYGNISVSTDVDQADQRLLGIADIGSGDTIDGTAVDPAMNEIDNSDVVQAVMLRGSSYFQPNWKGITPTSSGQYTNFSLAEPAAPGETSPYDITLSGAQDADEMMSRKQQQRQHVAKQAVDGHVRATRNMFQQYFTEEMREGEEKEWWGAQAQDYETDFRAWT